MLRTYAATMLLSATLLFSVQPMFAKMALPLLGGTPAVWNTCLVFFQAVLLLGYLYAHVSTRLLGVRGQSLLHAAVVLAPLALLPIAVPPGWSPPTESTPVFWLLGMLCVAVGAPFFVLATTAPLVQHWFGQTEHPAADDPYFLYAASNAGSMLALLGYPVLVEPALRLDEQSRLWSYGYGALCVLLIVCTIPLWRARRRTSPAASRGAAESPGAAAPPAAPQPPEPRVRGSLPDGEVTAGRRLRWVLLSFVPSSWMMGVTTHVTTDIAPVPMLWVIPLGLYLLSFILVFAERLRFLHSVMVRLFPLTLLLLVLSVIFTASLTILVLHLAVFFIGCMVCHGDLARDRPPVTHLTEFYLWMSLGGVLGGAFNAIVAPLLFRWLLEYPLAVLLAGLLRRSLYPERSAPAAAPVRGARANPEEEGRLTDLAYLGIFVLVFAGLCTTLDFEGNLRLVQVTVGAVAVLVLFYFLDWPRWFALGVGTLLLAAKVMPPVIGTVQYTNRSFFGVHWVVDDPRMGRQLLNGTTKHGLQSLEPERRCEPLSYYWRGGPLGQVFDSFDPPASTNRVAVVGLGAGATVCYRDAGYHFTFYEIDPLVKEIAESPGLFTYLSDCGRGAYEIVLGDGRLKLAEAPGASYAMIVFDAFSSDSIPMHLLTREALAMYLDKLAPGGLLVFHVSNRHLDLDPVLAALAADAGLVCLTGDDMDYFKTNTDEKLLSGKMLSRYVVLARERDEVRDLAARSNWRTLSPRKGFPVWTDDYSSLVGILRKQ